MKKIIDFGQVWTCENLDTLAPINWEGVRVLFDDNSIEIFDEIPENFEFADSHERALFFAKQNFIKKGDSVVVTAGRTIAKGEVRIVDKFFDFVPNGTFGHGKTKYVVFTNGEKIALKNVANIFNKSKNPSREFVGLDLSGRIR